VQEHSVYQIMTRPEYPVPKAGLGMVPEEPSRVVTIRGDEFIPSWVQIQIGDVVQFRVEVS